MGKACLLVLCLASLYLGVDSIRKIQAVNDYDVIRHGPALLWSGQTDIYGTPSTEHRHYLYPPPSLIALLPLGVLPYHASGVLFAALRLGLMIALLVLCYRWLRTDFKLSSDQALLILLLVFAVCFRFIRSDFRNGQLNMILAAACIGGVWLAVQTSPLKQILGGVLIALAASVKVTPLIFAAPLLLHRRWKALAAMPCALVILQALLLLGAGVETNRLLWADWKWTAEKMIWEGVSSDEVISLAECAGALFYRFFVGEHPNLSGLLKQFWLAEAILLCGFGLFLRYWKFKRRGRYSMLWDLSATSLLLLLLSAELRKAHLCFLLFPLSYLFGCVLFERTRGANTAGAAVPQIRIGVRVVRNAALLIGCILLFSSTSIPTQKIFCRFPVNFTLFAGLCLLLPALFLAHPGDLAPPAPGGNSSNRT